MRWEEDEGMSEDIKIHHSSQLPFLLEGEELSSDWGKVTCSSCRLEMPLAEPERAPEYRVPQHVLDTDRRLGLADELRRAEQDYADAMKSAARAARIAEQAGQEVARIRALLAEQEPAWRTGHHGRPEASDSLSAAQAVAPVRQLFKPGPY
jgi:hypothetical protein